MISNNTGMEDFMEDIHSVICELVTERQWSLDQSLHELTAIRADLPTCNHVPSQLNLQLRFLQKDLARANTILGKAREAIELNGLRRFIMVVKRNSFACATRRDSVNLVILAGFITPALTPKTARHAVGPTRPKTTVIHRTDHW